MPGRAAALVIAAGVALLCVGLTSAAAALAAWAGVISGSLQAHNVPAPRAARLASMAIAVLEGGLIQARVAADQQPLLDASEELAQAFDAAITASAGQACSYSAEPRISHGHGCLLLFG